MVSCDKSQMSPKSNSSFDSCLHISSRTFYIGRHMFHKRVYLLWLAVICTVFWPLIYFSICMYKFYTFFVPVNFLIQSAGFGHFAVKLSSKSTSEARIWFWAITFSTLIIIVVLIEGWFLIDLILSLFVKKTVWCDPPQWLHLDREEISLSVFLTELSKSK